MAKATFLDFIQIRDTGKTKVFEVRSNQQDISLGTISWYGAWRKYVFFPALDTLFDVVCLGEITSFVTKLMEERKGGRSERE